MSDIKPWQPIEVTDNNHVVCQNCKGKSELNSLNHKTLKSDGICWICLQSQVSGATDCNEGRKDDSAKLRYSLLPVGTVNQVVQVLEYGASTKYEIDNWQKVPSSRTRYYDAAMRHIDAWWNGELLDLDKDGQKGSHLPHLAHAICCLMFLMYFDNEQ